MLNCSYISFCCTCHMAAMPCHARYHHVAASVRVITLRFYFPFLLLLRCRSLVHSRSFAAFFFFIFLLLFSVLVHSCHNSLLLYHRERNGVFYFSHSLHLLFSLVSFSLFCHCLCNSAEYFNIHFNYHLLLSRSLHSSLRIFFSHFFLSAQHLWAFVLYAFHFSFGLQFIFHAQSHSIFCAHPSARSLALCLSITDFFSSTIFLIPKQTHTQRARERERASYIFIPRWSIPHIKYSVFGAFLPFIIVIVCMVILS